MQETMESVSCIEWIYISQIGNQNEIVMSELSWSILAKENRDSRVMATTSNEIRLRNDLFVNLAWLNNLVHSFRINRIFFRTLIETRLKIIFKGRIQ